MDMRMEIPRLRRGIVVFGGGTATNSLVDVFESLRERRNCALQYIIPISDNGGSSSELIRVFGGPGTFIYIIISPSFLYYFLVSLYQDTSTVRFSTDTRNKYIGIGDVRSTFLKWLFRLLFIFHFHHHNNIPFRARASVSFTHSYQQSPLFTYYLR